VRRFKVTIKDKISKRLVSYCPAARDSVEAYSWAERQSACIGISNPLIGVEKESEESANEKV
jgi:hypothetical protein